MKSLLDGLPQLTVIKDLQKDLDLPPEFFDGLIREDDWSFIIKMHSLIEAAINHLLVETLNRPELGDVISRLALTNEHSGRLAFLKKMKLLDSESLSYVRALSQVRNRFVHDLANVNVDLKQFFSHMDKRRRQSLHNGFKWGYEDESQAEVRKGELYDLHELLKAISVIMVKEAQYKFAIWLGSIIVLRQVHDKVARKQYEERIQELDDQLVALFTEMYGEVTDST